ncbi:CDK inhibitor PHO81 [Mytilus galloprovincialis]|uniref:CDK inhibitor PHO81 n=1 Tax=Mytilus galloprovincialis TaxID=29158 RepID=A0A8B6CLA9_MYTGA|nr:CDK inhibitor PHO81 [Mytilus galloprovincialis]
MASDDFITDFVHALKKEPTLRGAITRDRNIDEKESDKEEIQPQEDNQKQHGLFPYYDYLLHTTVLDKIVLDNLISRCVLMIEDREEIIKPTTQSERNKVLLDILTERPYGTFQVFKDVLQESDPHNSDVQGLVRRMLYTESIGEHIDCYDIIFQKHKVKLQKNYMMLVHDSDCKIDIADHLYEAGVLNTEDIEDICSSSFSRQDSNRILYNKLFRKGEDAYKHLLEALEHGQYNELASALEKTQVPEHDIQMCQIGMLKLRERQKEKDFHMINAKIEELARTQDEVIPKNILEQFERRLKQWKEDDQKYVGTVAEKQVRKCILAESSVTIVGNSGTGKSVISRHVALTMMEQGYIIIPCDNPGDIRQWFKHGRKTVFVFDDVCGRYTLNQQIFNEWTQRLEHIQSVLEDNCCKIMSTCRLDVYKNEQLNSLSIFKTCTIDLSSEEFRLNRAEKLALAEVYFKDNADKVAELSEKYDFFPLLCSLFHKQKLQKRVNMEDFFNNPFGVFENELVELYRVGKAGQITYCSLVLCVMFNNTLTEENFSTKDKEMAVVIDDLLEECELEKGTPIKSLKKSLDTLVGTYVVKEESTYKIIHDKLFDILAKHFGGKMIQLFIEHAQTAFISERFIWKTADTMGKEIELAIQIPDKKINRYIERLLRDWGNGFVDKVFTNRNMESSSFIETFINNFNKLNHSKQKTIIATQDIYSKHIALGISCVVGSVDLVRWLIKRKSNINHCSKRGYSALFLASLKGYVDVVKELLQHSAEVNMCNINGASPLLIASQEGHIDVVEELLQHSAKVNKCKIRGSSPLMVASGKGHVNIVKKLLQHSAEVNHCSNVGYSPLLLASKEGHVDVVKELLQHSAEVNLCDDSGSSPLFIASKKGFVDVVKELFQHLPEVNLCKDSGESPLFIASEEGHVDVVKELLQHSPEVNKCNNSGASPLSIASQEGHVDVVKELLQHSETVNHCINSGTTPLLIASRNGHVDVVKELLLQSAEVNLCNDDGASPLWQASCNGHVEVVKELLQHSAEVNKCNSNISGTSPLSIASRAGHLHIVKELLQHSAEVNLCDDNGESPLLLSSGMGHVNILKELLQHSAEVNLCNNYGASPLWVASSIGKVNVVQELLQHAAEVNICMKNGTTPLLIASRNGHVDVQKSIYVNDDGASPLWQASCNGHVEVVKELLQHSAEVNKCKSNISGTSPLSIASYAGHLHIVKELLQHSAEVNLCNDEGESPLLLSCGMGHVNILKELLQHSADVNLCNNYGASPLWVASSIGKVYVVKELIQHAAEVNICKKNGTSPLSIASQEGYIEVVIELLQYSAEVNLCRRTGESPLLYASGKGHVNVVKELIQHSAEVNRCSNNGRSPLWLACMEGQVGVVKELIQQKAEVNLCTDSGASPLSIASREGNIDVVKELLLHSAEVNQCNDDGASPLYQASWKGHVEVVKELLRHSADVNRCSNNGISPLSIAKQNRHGHVVKVLLQDSTNVSTSKNKGRNTLKKILSRITKKKSDSK